jgi:SAM-dependent methyltransferase
MIAALAPRGALLDVAAGIGTQTLPLLAAGHEVIARDASSAAIARLRREARGRGLAVDAATGDMRDLGAFEDGRFGAVLAFDNSVPHLLDDAELATAFTEFRRVLRPGGVLILSVRDYGAVDRSPRSVHRYGERVREGRRFRVRQEWRWTGPQHYRPTMIVEELRDAAWVEVVRTTTAYYAVSIDRLLGLMTRAGFDAERYDAVPFYQPVLVGRRR